MKEETVTLCLCALIRLELGWSRVELSGSEYCVCEGQGSVSLDILRSGNTEESSYVTIKVSGLSAHVSVTM